MRDTVRNPRRVLSEVVIIPGSTDSTGSLLNLPTFVGGLEEAVGRFLLFHDFLPFLEEDDPK